MVQAIQELAKQSFFKELKFFVAGDGALFDQTVKPLKKYDNVHVEKRFFRTRGAGRTLSRIWYSLNSKQRRYTGSFA